MGVFLEDLLAADFPFLRYALLMALLASVSVGATGAMASAQRVGYLVAAIAHASLAGIAAVLWLQETADWSALDPAAGALFAALGAAAIFAWMRRKRPENADALIGAVWSTGMAVGLLILSATHGYADPMSYLFGDILLLSERELVWALGLSAVIVGLTANYFRQIEAVCFDPEFARVRGVPVDRITLLILLLTALTATLLSMLVGIVLAVALVSLPTAIARPFSRNLRSEMLLAGAAAAVVTTGGIALSYPFDLPTGPTIVMTGAVGYFAVAMIKR